MEEYKGGAAHAYGTSAVCPAPITISVPVLLHCVPWPLPVPLWQTRVLYELYPEESWEHSCLYLDFKGWGLQAEFRAWESYGAYVQSCLRAGLPKAMGAQPMPGKSAEAGPLPSGSEDDISVPLSSKAEYLVRIIPSLKSSWNLPCSLDSLGVCYFFFSIFPF